MSRKFQEFMHSIVHDSLKEWIRPCLEKTNPFIRRNDPYGLCLEKYKSSRHQSPNSHYRTELLFKMNRMAKNTVPRLTDPEEIRRCKEIVEKTETDRRADKKVRKKKGPEIIDIFAGEHES